MGVMASQITSLTIVYSIVYSGADQRKHQSSVTGLCAGNSPVTNEFPAQMACNAKNVSIWWRHHETRIIPEKSNRTAKCNVTQLRVTQLTVKQLAIAQLTFVFKIEYHAADYAPTINNTMSYDSYFLVVITVCYNIYIQCIPQSAYYKLSWHAKELLCHRNTNIISKY